MTELDNFLWRIETTSDKLPVFHVLACCLFEAASLAQDHADTLGEHEVVVAVEMLNGPLVVDGDPVEDSPKEERRLTSVPPPPPETA